MLLRNTAINAWMIDSIDDVKVIICLYNKKLSLICSLFIRSTFLTPGLIICKNHSCLLKNVNYLNGYLTLPYAAFRRKSPLKNVLYVLNWGTLLWYVTYMIHCNEETCFHIGSQNLQNCVSFKNSIYDGFEYWAWRCWAHLCWAVLKTCVQEWPK